MYKGEKELISVMGVMCMSGFIFCVLCPVVLARFIEKIIFSPVSICFWKSNIESRLLNVLSGSLLSCETSNVIQMWLLPLHSL